MTGDPGDRIIAFASLGTLNVTQELAGAVLREVGDMESDLLAEETLCLAAVATSRAAEAGLGASQEVALRVVPVLMDMPYAYRDYIAGGEMLAERDPALVRLVDEMDHRLKRKQEFYRAHLAERQFPEEKALTGVMELWLGRISPPGLPEIPSRRLQRLGLVQPLSIHLRLVRAWCQKAVAGG